MKLRLSWGLLLPPLCSLLIAGGIVRYQSVRNTQVATELRDTAREVARLEKMLPPGHPAARHVDDDCDDPNHAHNH